MRFGKGRAAVLCGLLLVAAGIFSTPVVTNASPFSANGKLTVKKGKVVNQKGKPYVIKGVSTHGLAWYPQYVNKGGFRTLKEDWGVNTIRLAAYTEEYNGYCNAGKENQKKIKSLIDKGVKACKELGMYAIIDWHILSDGNPLQHKEEAKSFFKEMAGKYKKYSNVIFEICNEPNGSGGTWKNIRSYANTIVKTIRDQKNSNLIIVGTPNWSQNVEEAVKSPVKGKNIAYAFHFYANTHKEDMRKKLEGALKAKLPVVVTEFGIMDASGNGTVNTKEGNKWMKLLDTYKVGRVCWNLSNKDESSALLKSSCKKIKDWKTSDLTKQGKWYRALKY